MTTLACTTLWLVGCRPLEEANDASVDNVEGHDDGPVVEVLSPLEASDPNEDDVLVASDLEIVCRAAARDESRPVNPSSVKAMVFVGESSSAAVTAAALARGDGTYTASVALDAVEEGALRFACTAQDTSGRVGRGEVTSLYDRGPTVTFISPTDGSAVSRQGRALVVFTASPRPLTGGDQEADVGELSVRVNGKETTPDVDPSGSYSLSLDLTDIDRFPLSTEELQIEVEAGNRRTPETAKRLAQLRVAVDGEGPQITLLSPKDLAFVGQKAEVLATVRDELSGIKEGSIRATVSVDDVTDVFPMQAVPAQPERYATTFLTTAYENRAQLTVNVIAEDKAGNETRLASVVYVDNVPPWVSLDPPPVRLLSENAQGDGECSAPFDPVGPDAANDLQTNEGLFARYRALVWERGVELEGQQVVRVAEIAPETVAMYVQGRPDVPLVIDTDGDGICDRIDLDPLPLGAVNDPVKVSFKPVPPGGAPPPGSMSSEAEEPATGGRCELSNASPPARMCGDTDTTVIIKHEAEALGTVIYALDPKSSGIGCTGVDWQATVDGGWACIVAAAEDKTGNLGISMPLRVCYDVPVGSGKCADSAPPSCTDGCVMPTLSSERGYPLLLRRRR